MVLVDVFVPSVDKTYNFNLNESVSVESLILEITEMIEQKERTKLVGDKKNLRLYNVKEAMVLPAVNTLSDCYVTSGTRLMLV